MPIGLLVDGCGALVHCLDKYAWRPVTAARIRVRDVDLTGERITLQAKSCRGQDTITHPLEPDDVPMFASLIGSRQPGEPLFLNPYTGLAFEIADSRGIPAWFRRFTGMNVYELKRAAISRMLSAGIAPQDVALFSGHKTVSQMLCYARTNESRARGAQAQRKAAAPANRSRVMRAPRSIGVGGGAPRPPMAMSHDAPWTPKHRRRKSPIRLAPYRA